LLTLYITPVIYVYLSRLTVRHTRPEEDAPGLSPALAK
jgi:hypothetical protein